MTHPFWFYGAHPAEWYDGGRFDYEIRFTAIPGPAERLAIAAAIRAVTHGYEALDLDPFDTWEWADRWTKVVVRTQSVRIDWGWFFSEVDAFFRLIHRAWPIDAVVCRSVEPTPELPDDPWTAASLAAAPEIGPRPRWSDGPKKALDRFAPRTWLVAEVFGDDAFDDARVPLPPDDE